MKKLLFLISFLTILGGANSVKAIVLGDEITSLSGITNGTMFIISDGTKAKYFYGTGSGSGENENKNEELASIPAGSYFYFTLEEYTDGDIPNTTSPADNIYRIKITNAEGTGYPYGSNSGHYLNAVLSYSSVVISGPEAGWNNVGNEKKDALWYVTYDEEKGFSFQNVYRAENSLSSWLAIGNNFEADQQYLKLYSKPVLVEFEFDAFGKGTVDKSKLTATDGLTYDPSTGALSSNGTAGSLILEFATPVDMRNLFQFNLAQSGSTGDILSRLEFYDEDDAKINTWNGLKLGNKGWPTGIDDAATNAFLNHKPVKKMVWPSDAKAENEGKTATITSVEFICKTIACVKAGETQLKTLPWNKIDGSGTATPNWNMNGTSDTYYGDYSGNPTHYADLTAYSELRVYCASSDDGFRAFFINSDKSTTNEILTTAATWHESGKYYSLDLSTIEKWDNKVALKSIKSDLSWKGGKTGMNVKNIVVYKAPAANAPQYILTGSGMQLAETVAALADATATAIDATGVTGITTNSEAGRTSLTSANPNCLFLGTTGNGGLANTKNVISSGTCDKLVLTDGYPFKAPSDFTATAASYSRNLGSAGAGTLCLPFEAAIPDGVTAYTLNYTLGKDKAKATGVVSSIPANTPVLLNGTGSATFSGSTVDIDADATNVSGALTGVFMATTVPQDSYVLQDGDNGIGFYLVNSDDIIANPFRAYLTADGAGARSITIEYDDVTGVSDVKAKNDISKGVYYNLSGQRVSKPTKGLFIVDGKVVRF